MDVGSRGEKDLMYEVGTCHAAWFQFCEKKSISRKKKICYFFKSVFHRFFFFREKKFQFRGIFFLLFFQVILSAILFSRFFFRENKFRIRRIFFVIFSSCSFRDFFSCRKFFHTKFRLNMQIFITLTI